MYCTRGGSVHKEEYYTWRELHTEGSTRGERGIHIVECTHGGVYTWRGVHMEEGTHKRKTKHREKYTQRRILAGENECGRRRVHTVQ